jgi:hypothetical protein
MGAFEKSGEGPFGYKWNIRNQKHQYVIALYFSIMTLTTVGYGDVLATTIPEYAVMIMIMFVGGFMWAYIIGAVTAVITTLDIKKIEHQQLYDQINSMLVDMSIERTTAARVRSFLFQSEQMERRDVYSELIEFLSPELQGLMCNEISSTTLGRVAYFVHRTNRFRFAVYKALTRRLHVPQELIHEDRLLIIANQGVVGSDGRIYTRGMALNTDFFLYSDELREAGTLITRALNYVELELLSRRDFSRIQAIPGRAALRDGLPLPLRAAAARRAGRLPPVVRGDGRGGDGFWGLPRDGAPGRPCARSLPGGLPGQRAFGGGGPRARRVPGPLRLSAVERRRAVREAGYPAGGRGLARERAAARHRRPAGAARGRLRGRLAALGTSSALSD